MGKSYAPRITIYDRDDIMLLNEVDKEITSSDLEALETFADRIFGKVGIDVEFTRHFLDRVNDERNGKQITASELTRLFKQEYKKWGKPIAQMGPDAEAVMKDLSTDINMPFALRWDNKNKELDLIAKTVMRKPNFKTSNREFAIEKNPHRDIHNALSSKENRDIDIQRQEELDKKAALVKKFAQIEKGRHAVAIEDPIDYKMNADNSATMPYTPYKSKAANYAANVKPEYYFKEELNEFTISDLKYMGITHITSEQKKELQKISHENNGNITRSDLKKVGLLLQTRHVREEECSACDGTGWDKTVTSDEDERGCDECGGTGEIEELNELWPALAVAGAAGYGLYKGGKAIGKWLGKKRTATADMLPGSGTIKSAGNDLEKHKNKTNKALAAYNKELGEERVAEEKDYRLRAQRETMNLSDQAIVELVASLYKKLDKLGSVEKELNEESGISKFNKEDPNNPEVLIQGYGSLMLNQIEDDLVRNFNSLTNMAEKKDWDNIDYQLNKTGVLQAKLEAIISTKEQLQSIRRKGGPKSRGITRESRISLYDALTEEDEMYEGMFDRLKVARHKKSYVRASARLHEMLQRKYKENEGNWRHSFSYYVAKIAGGFENVNSKLLNDYYLENYKSAFITETGGVGRVVPGVNTSIDVGPNEIKKQAAKFGNTVDKDGLPKKTFR
jgi:hypothetical protein